MSETRIGLEQISGLVSNQTLETHLTNLNSKVGFFGGQVENVLSLSGVSATQDMHVFVKADNKWVRYNSGSWVDVTAAGTGGGGGASDLDGLTDVSVMAPSNGEVLRYDGTTWENSTLSISDVTNLQTEINGKASSVHTHSISDVTMLQTTLDGKASYVHSHSISDITNLQTSLGNKADLASPSFTGTPTAPTATSGDNSTKVATTAFVTTAITNSMSVIDGGTF